MEALAATLDALLHLRRVAEARDLLVRCAVLCCFRGGANGCSIWAFAELMVPLSTFLWRL
jgi:hypothetical protein